MNTETHVKPKEDNIEGDVAVTRNVEFNVSFKLPRGTKKDEKGNPVDELGNPFMKRPPFKLAVPVPTYEGLKYSMREDPKVREYILDLVANDVYRAVRLQTDREDNPVATSDQLDLGKISISFLANEPPAERSGGGISKDTWDDWSKDYVSIMPTVTGKDVSAVQNAAMLFLKRLQPVKNNKTVLKFLQEQLALWAVNTSNMDDFAPVFEFLDGKISTFLKMDDEALLVNL